MLSSLIRGQEFAYFTITGEGNAQEIVEKYKLKPNEIWNAGDVAEGCYLYDQMCLFYKSWSDTDRPLEEHLDSLLRQSFRFNELPDDLLRTLHCVSYEYHSQAGGYYLGREHMRNLAQMKAEMRLYAYKMEVEDNHEHPCSRLLTPNDPRFSGLPLKDNTTTDTREYAYFKVTSNTLHADEISTILQLEPTESWSIGDRRRQSDYLWQWTSWKLESGLIKGEPIAAHLAALMEKLIPHTDLLYQLSRDFQTSFGLAATGTFPTSHQMHLNKELILQMAKLNLSLDCDLYFHYQD